MENGRSIGPQKVLRVPLPPAAGAAEDGPERRVRGRDAGGRRRHHHPDRVQGDFLFVLETVWVLGASRLISSPR